ncbi:NAD(P)-binding domain-containing protein [Phyllobacterium myrsinacearum]|uniref:Cation diffusion facilitator CzcD-associated flavoprotein CzcO n=1 Tax=Phyllobacterium myrsinacearum TaxID=28101 RepID=A0A839EUF7_9HYPH|nr:NAD(P)/FAD-dependent oxidoreductase [Phyllobacterium myrsinacearum]MBA8880047.1 cation diffusion facilitator CzcD-associated flavoprotein CzcO [Phyllobacterium myrsinacearum]
MTKPDNPDFSAQETLRLIGEAPVNWVPDIRGIDHNVTIIGGGQTGATFAFALRRAGIGKVNVIDAADDESHAGVWLTRARMNKLRTPKSLAGPELGLSGLSFQSWYEARRGAEAYASFDRISRIDWADYLKWYRNFLGIKIRYATKLLQIEPADGHFRLHLDVAGRHHIEMTRKIVLGNGVGGAGGAYVPPALSSLPKTHLAHTSEVIDFTGLKGKSIAVVGSAASAFDAAATALENGAANTHLFARRASIANVPINRVRGYPGAYDNYPHLPDAIRWKQALRFRAAGSTPPPDAIERVVRQSNFHLHLGAPWDVADVREGKVVTQIHGQTFDFDFVIAGTGYFADPAARPELVAFADKIRLWRDQYSPAADERDSSLEAHPYLGLAHEFLEKVPGQAPYLKDIHVYNPAGFVSFGLPIGDVPSIRRDVPAVVARISRDLFLADLDHHEKRITGSVDPEFSEQLYASAIWQAETIAAE